MEESILEIWIWLGEEYGRVGGCVPDWHESE
jgi:hypothetical protein